MLSSHVYAGYDYCICTPAAETGDPQVQGSNAGRAGAKGDRSRIRLVITFKGKYDHGVQRYPEATVLNEVNHPFRASLSAWSGIRVDVPHRYSRDSQSPLLLSLIGGNASHRHIYVMAEALTSVS